MNGPTLPPPPPPPGIPEVAVAPPAAPAPEGLRPAIPWVAGLLATVLVAVGVVAAWPDDEAAPDRTVTAAELFSSFATTVPGAIGEPSQGRPRPDLPDVPTLVPTVSLFEGGAPSALQDLLAAAGQPTQVFGITLYDTYAFLEYRDPANPGNIDRRLWREGEVGEADANPIDDRVDADTEPGLFSPSEVDLGRVQAAAADAVTRYEVPVVVTHVTIDRFLPFDERVLIRVYVAPSDGRSGGGYVSYDTAGTFVKECC